MTNSTEGSSGYGDHQPQADLTKGNESSPEMAIQTMDGGSEKLWTMDEMMEAIPCDIIEVSEHAPTAADQAEAVKGKDGGFVFEAGAPDEKGAPVDELDPQATAGGYNYPAPFTRHPVMLPYTHYPYCTIGKLFFVRNGARYVCSASSIGNNAIFTAGHCLHAGDNKASGWSTDVVFVPGYHAGKAPFGQWQAKQLFVRSAWYRDGNPKGLCQDMGAAVLHPLNGKKISQVVGWLGFAWNWSKYQHWGQHGYPAASPFDGNSMIVNYSSFAYDGNAGGTPHQIGVGSDLTGGSSGGPWILRLHDGNYLNGVNSYRRSTNSQEMFSPNFTDNAKSLFDTVSKI